MESKLLLVCLRCTLYRKRYNFCETVSKVAFGHMMIIFPMVIPSPPIHWFTATIEPLEYLSTEPILPTRLVISAVNVPKLRAEATKVTPDNRLICFKLLTLRKQNL